MFTTRWHPFVDFQSDINRVRDEMDRLFGRYTGRRFPLAPSSYPLLNISEDDDRVYVEAELPGMEMDDLEILVHGSQLSIKGQRPQPSSEDKTWHRQERGYGKFTRMIELPFELDQAEVEAELKNGVLTITLPKREESKPRRIEVKAN
jgi:HSP20 family protein